MSSEPAEAPLASPCRRQCCLNDDEVCLGCGRTLQDILDWGSADNVQRQLICEGAVRRLQQAKHRVPRP